jgi:hypothetical protein
LAGSAPAASRIRTILNIRSGRIGFVPTCAYIDNQAEHHKKLSFKEELQIILKKHEIEYEDWMLD